VCKSAICISYSYASQGRIQFRSNAVAAKSAAAKAASTTADCSLWKKSLASQDLLACYSNCYLLAVGDGRAAASLSDSQSFS